MRLLGNILGIFPLWFCDVFAFFGGDPLTVAPSKFHRAWFDSICRSLSLRAASYAMIDKRNCIPTRAETSCTPFFASLSDSVLPLGVIFFLWGIAQVVVMCCTIVLLPMAIPYAKSLSTFFNPVGKVCVPVAVMDELERRRLKRKWIPIRTSDRFHVLARCFVQG